jgi:hypothetical protein
MRTMTFDLFYFWRWILVVVCTIYAAARLGQTAWHWYVYLWAESRSSVMMRRYVFVHALRVRMRRLTFELVQIVALVVLFALATWAHRLV